MTDCAGVRRLWDEVQRSSEKRRRGLSGALGVAREFWAALRAVSSTLAELADTLAAQPPPAAHPPAIQQQQLALQEIRHEIDHTKPEVLTHLSEQNLKDVRYR